MPQLLKRPQAEEDLLDIWCYIALDNPDAADAKPASKSAWTKKLWIYDYRTNVHKTLKQKRLSFGDFKEFIELYCAGDRSKRRET